MSHNTQYQQNVELGAWLVTLCGCKCTCQQLLRSITEYESWNCWWALIRMLLECVAKQLLPLPIKKEQLESCSFLSSLSVKILEREAYANM